jgi:hypothetical protein
MLRVLVPQGRTHRLAVVVAGMLQHAVAVAATPLRRRASGSAAARALLRASDELDAQSGSGPISDLVRQLFRDAGVSPDRVSARGQAYSIVESVIQEFMSWENMPWE